MIVSTANKIIVALIVLIFVTTLVYYIQLRRAYIQAHPEPTPIYIAKPNWYVNNMEWQRNQVLYDGNNLYYSDHSKPKTK